MVILRSFNVLSMIVRLLLAMLAGGVIGYGRSKKRREAGMRTYMLTSIGAALTVLLAMYEYEMLQGPWAEAVAIAGAKFDATRYASQVLSGLGFLGAGTILSDSHNQVRGLSSSTALIASASMGMAAGAGFYECVLLAVIMIIFVLEWMYPIEQLFKRRVRNMTLFAEFDSIENISDISDTIRSLDANVYDIDIERTKKTEEGFPSATFTLQLSKNNNSHTHMLTTIAELSHVHFVQELLS